MYCNKNKLPALTFCAPHSKPYGTRGLSKHYHFLSDPKLGGGVCAIRRIPCSCVAYTSIIYKPWISVIPSDKQEDYKPVTKCNCWPVLGYFDNWNITQLSQKSTPSG